MDEPLEDWQRPGAPAPSPKDLREAARAIRSLDVPIRRQVLHTIRPPGVMGFLGSHAPLRVLLRLAAEEERLVWQSPDCFAVLEPPRGAVPEVPKKRTARARRLRWLDQYWEVLLFAAAPFTLLAAAAIVAWTAPSTGIIALGLVLLALAIVCTVLLVLVVLQSYRLLSGRRRMNETAVGQVRAAHWTVVLGHVDEPDEIGRLLAAARSWGDPAGTPHPVLYLESGITSAGAREVARSLPMVVRLSETPPVYVYASLSDPPLAVPSEPGRLRGRDLAIVLGGSTVALLLLALVVPSAERISCVPASSCASSPLTYLDALYWLFNRLLGGDPEGLGVLSPGNRLLGLLLSFYGVVVLVGIVDRVIQQQIDESVASGPNLVAAFNDQQRARALATIPVPPPAGKPVKRWRPLTWLRGRLR